MTNAELLALVETAVERATDAQREAFAIETLDLMLPAAEAVSLREHEPGERTMFSLLTATMHDQNPPELAALAKQLAESMCETEEREFDYDLIEYLGAVDRWIEFRATGNPKSIEDLALNRLNVIDFDADGDLDAPEMQRELQRIQQRLAGTLPEAS